VKKYCFILMGFLIISFSLLSVPHSYAEDIGNILIHFGYGDAPSYGINAELDIDDEWVMSVSSFQEDAKLHIFDVLFEYRLSEPLWRDTRGRVQAGYSEYLNKGQGIESSGLTVGLLFERTVGNNIGGFTRIASGFYRGKVLMRYETGFDYYFEESNSIRLYYRGYDSNHHPALGFKVSF